MPPLDPSRSSISTPSSNVAPDADAAAIERAWRAGVRSVHPDRALSGDERAATTRTARLNIAREWLMDPTKRARYDLLRRPGPRIEIPDDRPARRVAGASAAASALLADAPHRRPSLVASS